jgi:hypothetical protein
MRRKDGKVEKSKYSVSKVKYGMNERIESVVVVVVVVVLLSPTPSKFKR